MNTSFRSFASSGAGSALLACVLVCMGGFSGVQAATTVLSDTPLYSASDVPANLMLALSVEFPTGTVAAYKDASGYSASSVYLGYFDNAKCYDYSTTNGYFTPVSKSVNCTGHWSGNMLNWATMTALDEFRQSLTGGNRSIDTTTNTVLIRSNLNSQSNSGNFPDKHLSSSLNVSPATVIGDAPYKSSTDIYLRSYAQGTKFIVSNNSGFSNTGTTGSGNSKFNNSATSYNAQVQVCVVGLLESNCNSAHASTDYPNAGVYNKPDGLIQQNYTKIRVGAAGYVFQNGNGAANGVVRALIRDNGPTTYNGNGARQINNNSEWSATTGIFTSNPYPGDDAGTAPGGADATTSGAINYLNKFGYANGYETYDTIADLYWASLAYLMNVPLDASYTTGLTASNSLDTAFPVLTGSKLNDPIAYTCQSNSIVTIGDAHTWYDTRVPSSGGPTPSSGAQAALAPVNGADAALYATKLGNLPLIEGTAQTMASLFGSGVSLGNRVEPNGTTNSTYNMAGLAYFAHTQDIRPDKLGSQNVTTYTVDVLEPGSYDGTSAHPTFYPAGFNTGGGSAGPNMYWLAAKYGGFNDVNLNGIPANFLTWHTNSTTVANKDLRPDNYFPGNRPDLIQSGLQQIFYNVASTSVQRGAGPSISATRVLTPITASSVPYNSPVAGFPIYNVQYKPITWDGDVSGAVASTIAGGTVTPVAGSNTWSAQAQLEVLTQTVAGSTKGWDSGRRIITWNGAKGVPFRYSNLSATEQTALNSDSNLLNFLRGDKTYESVNYHTRAHILGDIVNSQAVLVQNASSPSYTESANPGYTAFSTSIQNRQPVVYVGANDGMLHAFAADFSLPTGGNPVTGGGSELFAYVPGALYQGPNGTPQIDGLAALANLNGVTTNNYAHHFYVDHTPQVGDVDFSLTGLNPPPSTASSSDWHSLLVGGLGKGGKSIYALDITSVPSAIQTTGSTSTTTGEPKLASKALWEFTSSDMGYSYGRPLIVKTRKYGWVVVMTSGYDNPSGNGHLYVLNAKTGALLETINTPTSVGSPSNPIGLTQATGYTQNVADGTIDQVYAGDLFGDVWRFDLSESALDGSGQPTGPYPAPVLFAQLTDPSGVAQPITTAPRIELNIDSTGIGTVRTVFVGTGKFLDTSDLSNTQQQTMYALIDGDASTPSPATTPLTRSNLIPNDLIHPLDLTGKAGWYYDLTGTAGAGGGTERIVVDPDAAAGVSVITWATVTPSTDPCSLLGNIYAADFTTGQSVLQDSAGNLMTSITTASATTQVQVIQLPNGQYAILYGQTGSLPKTAKIKQPSGSPLLNMVNWREILN